MVPFWLEECLGKNRHDVIIAGGAESMSNAPFFSIDMRWNIKGDGLMLHDGLSRGRYTAGGKHHPVPGGMIETAENLRRNGGYIPGIRPGKTTADYLDNILTRLTVLGAAYLSFVCLLPEILISQYSVPFYLGGTSLLIVVTVTLDTVGQIQSHLLAHQYEGLVKKSKLKGRNR